MDKTPGFLRMGAMLTTLLSLALPALAGEWTHWRGPHGNGVADESGLISSWSKDGENLIWRDNFVGRSTPVVLDGRVCAIGRVGEGINRQETVACWNAENGKRLWERRFNVYHTAVPWNRVGWADLGADVETGYVYAQAVNGRLIALDKNGETVWEWLLGEDLGRFSGYGGRTNSPIVDENRLLVHVIGSAWGKDLGPPGDRYYAFDKRTGEVLWISPKGDQLQDLNTYSTHVVAEIGGQRLLIGGGADGWIRAFQARTGEPVWSFHLSQRGLNSSVVVAGSTVYATHSEENLDEGTMGRVVAIDGTGRGDVTKSHERWRVNELQAGYASPFLHEDRLYVVDNSANLHAIDAANGKVLWHYSLGTVGKASPVYADGKIYAAEVNGNVHILQPGDEGATALDAEHLEMPDGRYAEIYGSPAVAYGRIYFTTEEGIYCLGDKSKAFTAGATPAMVHADGAPDPQGKPAVIRVVPAVVVGKASDPQTFRVDAFDANGSFLGHVPADSWALVGLPGKIDDQGRLALEADKIKAAQVGRVTAKVDGLSHTAHLRVAGDLPWEEDFETIEIGKAPASWFGTGKGANVQDIDGSKVLVVPKAAKGAPRANLLLGPSYLSGYTVQADFKGSKQGRRFTDIGLINSGYIFDLQGAHQRIEVRSWASELRMAQKLPFPWNMDTWYTMKLRVDYENSDRGSEVAQVRGKVWPRGEDEPRAWTFSVEDPLPIRQGSPGLYAFSPVEAYFDNVKVTVSR